MVKYLWSGSNQLTHVQPLTSTQVRPGVRSVDILLARVFPRRKNLHYIKAENGLNLFERLDTVRLGSWSNTCGGLVQAS